MAPELLEGIPTKSVDIFSLGATTFEMVTNYEMPKNGETWHMLRNGKVNKLFRRDKYSKDLM